MSKFTAAMTAAKERTVPETPEFLERESPTVLKSQDQFPRRGRPTGTRSSESTIQVTAYIEASTHYETKIKLLQNAKRTGERQDFSMLIEQLLTEWLKSQL